MNYAIPAPEPVVWLGIEALPIDSPDSLQAMIYAPGSLCEHCNQLLHTGFVFQIDGELTLAGQVCLMGNFNQSAPPFVRAVEQAQYYGGLWPVNESSIRRRWRSTARALGLLLQVEPDHPFGLGMFRLLESGKALSDGQATTVQTLISERGGVKSMKRRRDLIQRLDRLKSLDLASADFDWVLDVLGWARRWRAGQMNSLTQKQEHKIIYLEETHISERRKQVRAMLNTYSLEFEE